MVVDEDESNAVLANTGADAATEMIIQYLFLGLVEHEMITYEFEFCVLCQARASGPAKMHGRC